ncbi:MAG: hypothetical protein MUC96_17150 [Myxococcaceae bacterium]|jgi:hypothetical protein|nr:hypothetical protein [Myxococcaceae bacterium]
MVLALACALTFGQVGDAAPREDEALAFARTLLAEQDPYRAITELKRFAFLRGGPAALHAHLLIGQVYAKGRMVDASRFHLDRVIAVQEPRTATAARLLSLENVCVTRLLSGNCAEAIAELPDDTPLGLKDHYSRYFGVLMGSAPLPQKPPDTFDALDRLTVERAQLPLQRPWLAGVLSAVLPGAGQVYNGRLLDASLAFVLTGATVAGTVALLARPQPEWGFGIPLGLLALVFYTGNIVNAVGDAFRLNEQTYAAFAKKLEAEAWPKLGLTVGPNGGSFTLTVALGAQAPRTVVESAP